jgi:NTE family protein
VFQVDLFSTRGMLPRDIEDVMGRHKDIMYSSRTRYTSLADRGLRRKKERAIRSGVRLRAFAQ